MMARLEMYNSLAPIQEYGRHQTKTSVRKKKAEAAKKAAIEAISEKNESKEKDDANFDDKFYDLDDGFIDDGEIDSGAEIGGDYLYGDGGFSDLKSHDITNEPSHLRK